MLEAKENTRIRTARRINWASFYFGSSYQICSTSMVICFRYRLC